MVQAKLHAWPKQPQTSREALVLMFVALFDDPSSAMSLLDKHAPYTRDCACHIFW